MPPVQDEIVLSQADSHGQDFVGNFHASFPLDFAEDLRKPDEAKSGGKEILANTTQHVDFVVAKAYLDSPYIADFHNEMVICKVVVQYIDYDGTQGPLEQAVPCGTIKYVLIKGDGGAKISRNPSADSHAVPAVSVPWTGSDDEGLEKIRRSLDKRYLCKDNE